MEALTISSKKPASSPQFQIISQKGFLASYHKTVNTLLIQDLDTAPITDVPQDLGSYIFSPFLGPFSLKSVHTPPTPSISRTLRFPAGHSEIHYTPPLHPDPEETVTTVTHKGASSEVGPWRVPSPLRPKTGASALPCSTALTDLPQAPSGSAPPFLLSVSLWAYAKTTGQWGESGGIRGLTEAPSGRRCTVVAKETRGPGAARGKQGAGQKRACSRGSAPRTSAPPSSSRLPLGTPLGFFPSPSPSVLGTEHAQPPVSCNS